IGIILQVTGVVTPKVPSGFAATNSMAIALLVVLVVLTALPIVSQNQHLSLMHFQHTVERIPYPSFQYQQLKIK
ncbi:hypothetical protein ACTPEM_24955, partial [Clostridioides difficile]